MRKLKSDRMLFDENLRPYRKQEIIHEQIASFQWLKSDSRSWIVQMDPLLTGYGFESFRKVARRIF